jgi:hypothetical protein
LYFALYMGFGMGIGHWWVLIDIDLGWEEQEA